MNKEIAAIVNDFFGSREVIGRAEAKHLALRVELHILRKVYNRFSIVEKENEYGTRNHQANANRRKKERSKV